MTPRVYLHSPSEAPDAAEVARRIPEFERYGERALLLARPGDLVCLAHPVDDRYLRFLRALRLGPRAEDVLLVEGVAPGSGLSARLAADPRSFDRLAGRLTRATRATLVPFFAGPATAVLARALVARIGCPVHVEGGPPSLVRRLHEKRAARALARMLRIPFAPGTVVRTLRRGPSARRDFTAFGNAVRHWCVPTGRAIVRGSSGASGSSTFVLEPDGLDDLVESLAGRTDNDAYLVQPFFDASVSPNVEVVATPGSEFQATATDQILSPDLVYQGSRHPSLARAVDRMLEDSLRMARWMHAKGFGGRVGFDFVEHDGSTEPGYFLCEINPRVNGASYPVELVARLGELAAELGAPAPRAFVARFVAVDAASYPEVEERCEFLLYDSGRGEGIIPHTTGGLEYGKLGVTSLADTRPRAEEILGSFIGRIGSARPSTTST